MPLQNNFISTILDRNMTHTGRLPSESGSLVEVGPIGSHGRIGEVPALLGRSIRDPEFDDGIDKRFEE